MDNRGHWGGGDGVNQRGVMEEGGGVDLSVDNSGSLDHRLDNWGVGNSGNWGGEGSGVEDGGGSGESVEGSHSGGSNCERGRSGNSGGSSHNRGGGSGDNHGGCGGDGINKSILVQVLRESLEGE